MDIAKKVVNAFFALDFIFLPKLLVWSLCARGGMVHARVAVARNYAQKKANPNGRQRGCRGGACEGTRVPGAGAKGSLLLETPRKCLVLAVFPGLLDVEQTDADTNHTEDEKEEIHSTLHFVEIFTNPIQGNCQDFKRSSRATHSMCGLCGKRSKGRVSTRA